MNATCKMPHLTVNVRLTHHVKGTHKTSTTTRITDRHWQRKDTVQSTPASQDSRDSFATDPTETRTFCCQTSPPFPAKQVTAAQCIACSYTHQPLMCLPRSLFLFLPRRRNADSIFNTQYGIQSLMHVPCAWVHIGRAGVRFMHLKRAIGGYDGRGGKGHQNMRGAVHLDINAYTAHIKFLLQHYITAVPAAAL